MDLFIPYTLAAELASKTSPPLKFASNCKLYYIQVLMVARTPHVYYSVIITTSVFSCLHMM